MHRHIAGTHDLEPVHLDQIVDLQHRSRLLVAIEAQVLVTDPDQPEQAGQVEDRIRVIDVLAVARADVVQLRPRTGVV